MDELDKKFVSFYQRVGKVQGMDNSLVSIFALLYLEPDELSLEDLAKKSGYSLASVSNKVRMLETSGFVSSSSKPGTRKVYVTMGKNILKLWKQHLILKQKGVLQLAKERIPEIIRESRPKVKTERERKKIKILEGYYKQMIKFEQLIQEFIIKIEKIDK